MLVNHHSKSLEDVGLRAELNIPVIIVSVILMFFGIVIPPILIEYRGIDLLVAILLGALVSIVGNLVLLYGQRNKLVKVFHVEFKDFGKGEDVWKVEKLEQR